MKAVGVAILTESTITDTVSKAKKIHRGNFQETIASFKKILLTTCIESRDMKLMCFLLDDQHCVSVTNLIHVLYSLTVFAAEFKTTMIL